MEAAVEGHATMTPLGTVAISRKLLQMVPEFVGDDLYLFDEFPRVLSEDGARPRHWEQANRLSVTDRSKLTHHKSHVGYVLVDFT
jgi:hypothetical protein